MLVAGWVGTETVLDYWGHRCWADGTAPLDAGPPPRLSGDKCWLAGLEAGLLHSETKLSHLVLDATLGMVFLGVGLCCHSNKSFHYTSNPPMHVSLKCISCDTVEESCFLRHSRDSNLFLFLHSHRHHLSSINLVTFQWLWQTPISLLGHSLNIFD